MERLLWTHIEIEGSRLLRTTHRDQIIMFQPVLSPSKVFNCEKKNKKQQAYKFFWWWPWPIYFFCKVLVRPFIMLLFWKPQIQTAISIFVMENSSTFCNQIYIIIFFMYKCLLTDLLRSLEIEWSLM